VSIVVRRLGNADDITFSTGLGGVDATTYGTIAVLFRPSADPVFRWLVKLYDSAGGDLGGVGILGNGTTFWKGSGPYATEGPIVTFDDWHLLVARKDTGDVRPRFSLKNVTTGIWEHDDAVDTQLDWVAPTGGSVRTKDATSGEGPGADYAAAAIWANELPWAADTFGDAIIETAGLDEHLDNWRGAGPASGWEFSQTDADFMVEDFTLNRADETSVGVGTPTTDIDLDFVYADAGILALSRNFLRDTQNEPGATGIIHDLSETQGTPTTIGSGSVSSGSFVKVLEFWRVVDATVDASVAIDTSISMAAVSAATLRYQWIVHRYNSSDVLQESSTASSEHNTTGVKTQTMVLSGPFVAGDKLSVSLWLKKAGGGGSRDFTLNINNADSWVEFSVAEAAPNVDVDGDLASTATIAGSIDVAVPGSQVDVDGTRPVTTTLTGTAAVDRTVAGDRPITATLSGTATVTRTVDGSTAITATITGSIDVGVPGAPVDVDGTLAITAGQAGTAAADRPADGDLVTTVTTTGAASVAHPVNGDRATSTTLAGTATVARAVDGNRPTNVTLAGTADIIQLGQVDVDGTRPVTTTLTGTATTMRAVDGALPVTATTVGVAQLISLAQGTRPTTATITGTAQVAAPYEPIRTSLGGRTTATTIE
jgi:hypothetical protein